MIRLDSQRELVEELEQRRAAMNQFVENQEWSNPSVLAKPTLWDAQSIELAKDQFHEGIRDGLYWRRGRVTMVRDIRPEPTPAAEESQARAGWGDCGDFFS